jgi:prephenate dehydrogenase
VKLQIIGNGAFGSFLKELLASHFEIIDDADSVILAVPLSAYDEVSKLNKSKHLINVCSVQQPSTSICLKYSDRVTSIHPLFGRRTPKEHRNSILTYRYSKYMEENDTWNMGDNLGEEFIDSFHNISTIYSNNEEGLPFTPAQHDMLMAKTHLAAVMAAKQLQIYVDRAKDIPDFLLPNSFRMMKQFVQTLDDMPKGTIESIMGNPYF